MVRRAERFRKVLEDARSRLGVALMGICNVTPDSFSDGGRHFSLEAAKDHVRALLGEGADIIDVGGESTRPGSVPVSPADQLGRVLEVVRYAADAGACVSIDTASPEVAAACLDAGACLVNDVSCLRDETLASVCASHGAPLVLMHSREPMSALKGFSAYPDAAYGDIVEDVIAEWTAARGRALARGLPKDDVVMDPGLGFAKNARQSFTLLAATGTLAARLGVSICVGASRKSFLAKWTGRAGGGFPADREAPAAERVGASVAAALYAFRQGAHVLRVHDVRATRQAIDVERKLAPLDGVRDGEGGPF